MSNSVFKTYGSVEEAEKRLRQETLSEHAVALNNHADNLVRLNQHHEEMHAAVKKLQDQMDCLLEGIDQINKWRERIEARLEKMDMPDGKY